jgi:NADPH-dependent glutamate synthase beta subunit-like oxidoreductase
VQINALKRAAGEFSNGLPWGDRWGDSKAADSGKRVVVVGAGPAGLTAAYYLGKVCGHQVTLYESETEPGGQLYLGVPTFRLPRNVLRQEIQLICETRVELVCGHRIESLQRLIEQGFDAVFISIGAWAPVSLPISKAHLPEVVPSVEILRKANLGIFPKIGDRVRVIGGGNVAVDGARVALRLGAKDVKVLYRRSRKEMPAVESEASTAEKEGVKFEFLVSPVAIEEQPGGRLGLQLEETQLGEPDESGRPRPISTGRRSFQEGISQILIAAGQRPEIPPEWELDMNPEGTIKANRDTLETRLPGIFAGGDVTTGPLNFIGAVAHGRVAARSID